MSSLSGKPSNTSGAPPDRLLSSFRIAAYQAYQNGRPYQQTRLVADEGLRPALRSAKLKNYKNWHGHFYAESHVEEWVLRCPAALYPGQAVHVLASQNYARLGEPLDLLLLDDRFQFPVVELKAERVASNRGVTPDRIHRQMNRYVEFLESELRSFPASLSTHYAKFTERLSGVAQDLSEDLRQTFGEAFSPNRCCPPTLYRTFLTEGYDEEAVDYFTRRQRRGEGPFRLIYYRFYPEPEGHRIEFWEIPLLGDEALKCERATSNLDEETHGDAEKHEFDLGRRNGPNRPG